MLKYVKCRETGFPIVFQDEDCTLRPVWAISKALYEVFNHYAKGTRLILHRWFKAFILGGPPWFADLVDEEPRQVRARLEAMLRDVGCTFGPIRHAPRAMGRHYIKRSGGNAGEISVFISALADFYSELQKLGAREAANPLLIDDPERKAWAHYDVLRSDRRNFSDNRRFISFSRYVVVVVPVAPPSIKEPYEVLERILECGRASGWPEPVYLVCEIMKENGCRLSEALFPTAWHWFQTSQFGQQIQTCNGKSTRKKDKCLVLSQPLHDRLIAMFDGLKRPAFANLKQLARDEPDALRSIPLFTLNSGNALSDWTFRNDYFNPAMRDSEISVSFADGTEHAPKPHIFRHGYITNEVKILDIKYPDEVKFDRELERLAERMACTVQNIYRYADWFLERRKIDRQLKIAEDHRAVTGRVLSEGSASPTEAAVRRLKAMAG